MTLYLESTYFKMEIMLRLLFNLLQELSLILFTILVSPVFYQTNDNLNLILCWIFPFLSLVDKQLFYLPKSFFNYFSLFLYNCV